MTSLIIKHFNIQNHSKMEQLYQLVDVAAMKTSIIVFDKCR